MTRQRFSFMGVILLTTAAMFGEGKTPYSHNAAAGKVAAHLNDRTPTVDTSKWKTYRNEKYGFEVKYPETWAVQLSSGSGPTIIHFRKPHRDREPDVYLALGVQEGQNPNRLSIEQYFAQQLQAMKTIPPPTGHVTVGGQPAVFLENTNSLGTERVTYALLHETGLLTFIYTRQAQFDPILAAIVSTFRFIR